MRRALGLLLATAACGSNIALESDVNDVGPYQVGYREREIVYGERTLRLALWYPTEATSGRVVSYLDALERPGVYENAPALEREDLPVLVFSHGNTSFAEQSFFLTEFFATHGFVVAAPEHTGNTVVDIASSDRAAAVVNRPQDVSATIDWLYDADRNTLAAQLHEDAIALAGHSFGGYTTLAVSGATLDVVKDCDAASRPELCVELRDRFGDRIASGFEDDRVKVALPMSPSGMETFTASGVGGIDVPVALFTGRLDQTTSDATQGDLYWPLLGDDAVRLELLTGGHFTFSNACEVLPALGADDGCGEGMIPASDAHEILRTYALAFARKHLFDDDSVEDVLSGAGLGSAEAVVRQ